LAVTGFIFTALFFILYFIINYILDIWFVANIRLAFMHLKLVSMRPSLIKYNILFTLEELVIG